MGEGEGLKKQFSESRNILDDLATLYSTYEMELFDTVFERHVEVRHDVFLPQPRDYRVLSK